MPDLSDISLKALGLNSPKASFSEGSQKRRFSFKSKPANDTGKVDSSSDHESNVLLSRSKSCSSGLKTTTRGQSDDTTRAPKKSARTVSFASFGLVSTVQSNKTAGSTAIGDLVYIESLGVEGILRYLGPVEGRKGTWAGVELVGDSVGKGKNDGSVAGKRYFSCERDCGVFVSATRLSSLECRFSPTASSVSSIDEQNHLPAFSDSLLRHNLRGDGSACSSRVLPHVNGRNTSTSTTSVRPPPSPATRTARLRPLSQSQAQSRAQSIPERRKSGIGLGRPVPVPRPSFLSSNSSDIVADAGISGAESSDAGLSLEERAEIAGSGTFSCSTSPPQSDESSFSQLGCSRRTTALDTKELEARSRALQERIASLIGVPTRTLPSPPPSMQPASSLHRTKSASPPCSPPPSLIKGSQPQTRLQRMDSPSSPRRTYSYSSTYTRKVLSAPSSPTKPSRPQAQAQIQPKPESQGRTKSHSTHFPISSASPSSESYTGITPLKSVVTFSGSRRQLGEQASPDPSLSRSYLRVHTDTSPPSSFVPLRNRAEKVDISSRGDDSSIDENEWSSRDGPRSFSAVQMDSKTLDAETSLQETGKVVEELKENGLAVPSRSKTATSFSPNATSEPFISSEHESINGDGKRVYIEKEIQTEEEPTPGSRHVVDSLGSEERTKAQVSSMQVEIDTLKAELDSLRLMLEDKNREGEEKDRALAAERAEFEALNAKVEELTLAGRETIALYEGKLQDAEGTRWELKRRVRELERTPRERDVDEYVVETGRRSNGENSRRSSITLDSGFGSDDLGNGDTSRLEEVAFGDEEDLTLSKYLDKAHTHHHRYQSASEIEHSTLLEQISHLTRKVSSLEDLVEDQRSSFDKEEGLLQAQLIQYQKNEVRLKRQLAESREELMVERERGEIEEERFKVRSGEAEEALTECRRALEEARGEVEMLKGELANVDGL